MRWHALARATAQGHLASSEFRIESHSPPLCMDDSQSECPEHTGTVSATEPKRRVVLDMRSQRRLRSNPVWWVEPSQ
jgi:hypothetical protein